MVSLIDLVVFLNLIKLATQNMFSSTKYQLTHLHLNLLLFMFLLAHFPFESMKPNWSQLGPVPQPYKTQPSKWKLSLQPSSSPNGTLSLSHKHILTHTHHPFHSFTQSLRESKFFFDDDSPPFITVVRLEFQIMALSVPGG